MLEMVPDQDGRADATRAATAPKPEAPCEIELKLLAPPGAIEQVRNASIRRQGAGESGSRQLDAVYYDTPDRLLLRNGLSLRVRRSGKAYIQTLKRSREAAPLRRQEWETPVASSLPELGRLPGAEIGAPVAGLAGESLAPVFATRVRRRWQIVELPDATVELAFDEGTIEAAGRSEPLSEIELELKAGAVGALYDFGLALLEIAPLRLGASSKAERGYALAFGLPPATVKARPVEIGAGDTVDAAIAAILRNCQQHLMANLAAAGRGDVAEGVHQMRVGLRRLRAALSGIGRELPAPALEAIGQEARWLARILGTARNWDVFVTETLAKVEAAPSPDLALVAVRVAAAPLRSASHAAVREAFADPRASRLFLALGRLIERRGWREGIGAGRLAFADGAATILAGRALARSGRKALRRGRHFRKLTPEQRHRLRLALKELRYTAEFFAPLYAEHAATRDYLEQLSALQDALGADNDMTTTRPLLREILRGADSPALRRAVAAISDWQRQAQGEAGPALGATWRSFERTTPFWPG